MKAGHLHTISADWCRLGVLFNVMPSRRTPDMENLLIETATQISSNPRLFIMAATWLGQYGRLVARHRLVHMIGKHEDADTIAALGLLLDTVGTMCHIDCLDQVKSACRPAKTPKPLFLMDRASPSLAAFARDNASEISKRWNLWADAMEMKYEVLRPLDWIMKMNPSMQIRAVFNGNLRSSILACLEHDAIDGASEAELARLCGVTRKAVHEAVDHLEFCNMIQRTRIGRNYEVARKEYSLSVAG